MQFETTLNLVWLSLGLFGLASTIRTELRQRAGVRRRQAWLHIVGVGLIVAALFPYISATDDIVRVEHFNAQHGDRHTGSKHGRADNLMRLYETMDSPLVCRICAVAFTLLFISLVFTPVFGAMDRIAPFEAGRSPPTTTA